MARLRNPRPLIAGWVATIVLETILYWIVQTQPVWRNILAPFYILAAIPAALASWHFIRGRAHEDRRHEDRRHQARREK